MSEKIAPNEYGYLCDDCAEFLGGAWPKDHRATFHYDICPHCGSNRGLASWDDWDWPDNADLNKIARSTREI